MTYNVPSRGLVSFVIMIAILMPAFALSSSSGKNFIRNGGIDSVEIGDQAEKVASVFGNRYLIQDVKTTESARDIKLLDKGNNVIVKFTIDDKGRIFLIDVYSFYGTKEGIGVGSTLSDAQRAYGRGRIGPTDAGYLVTFENLERVGFLLNDSDILRELRRIPDDVVTKEQERRLLGIGSARIVSIEIF